MLHLHVADLFSCITAEELFACHNTAPQFVAPFSGGVSFSKLGDVNKFVHPPRKVR